MKTVESWMVSALSNSEINREYYGYAPDNKRVYKKRGDNQLEEFTFYVGNRRLGIGAISDDGTMLGITITPEYWFGGKKLAVRDRLGSAVKTLPYGQERSGAVQNADSFATYYRDKQTALDYADQRYYSAGMGRFTSPDPYVASGGVGSPGSWNRYAYAEGVRRTGSTQGDLRLTGSIVIRMATQNGLGVTHRRCQILQPCLCQSPRLNESKSPIFRAIT